MALAIAVTDNEDTTATVTVSGAGSSTVTIKRGVYGVTGTLTDTATVGLIVGDGDVIVAGAGLWGWYAQIGAGTPTSTTYKPITDGGDSVHERCLVMVKDRIDSLELPGLAGGVFIRQMGGRPLTLQFPCIVLTIAGLSETDEGGTNLHDHVGYPIGVQVAERCAATADEHRGRHLSWRNRIRNAVNHQHWDLRVPEVWKCVASNGAIISVPETDADLNYRVGLLTINCVARELVRGS